MALTPEGLIIKKYADLLADKKQRAIERFQDLVGPNEEVDVSDSSILGRLIALTIPSEVDLWEAVQQDYDAFNPNAATGISLDNLVALSGLVRFTSAPTMAQAVFTGDSGTIVPAGSVISSPTTSERFDVASSIAIGPQKATSVVVEVSVTEKAKYVLSYFGLASASVVEIDVSSEANPTEQSILQGLFTEIVTNHPLLRARLEQNNLTVESSDLFQVKDFTASNNLAIVKASNIGTVTSEKVGGISQPTNTITSITTPVLGWDSVYNPTPAIPGRLEETDTELRQRFRVSKYERASNILEALYTSLIAIPEVTELAIYENDTDVYNSDGVPPHSFMPVILGGEGDEIARTIWRNKPLGIRSHGNTSVTIVDSQGFPHEIGFERPNPVPVFITMNLTVSDDFPSSGAIDIRNKLVEYFYGLGIGTDVIYSRLFTPINEIKGHQVDSMFIGTASNPTGVTNIVVPFNGLATVEPENIIINTTIA